MGEENKNVKKPAVSKAVVKKKPMGTGAKSTGGTRPGNGTKSTGSTRPSNGAKSAGGTHTNKMGSGAKIAQPEAMEAAQKQQRTFKQYIRKKDTATKKKTQENNGKSVYIAACSCCRHYSAFYGKWHYAWPLSQGKADFKRICIGFEI